MTRIELTERLGALLRIGSPGNISPALRDAITALIDDIKLDGVLDVQQPPRMLSDEEIASCFRDTCGGGIDRTGVASDINRFVIATVRRLLERQQQAPSDIAATAGALGGFIASEGARVARLRAALRESGLTRDDVRACSVADLIALHEAMPS
jgi:hypothetical protein